MKVNILILNWKSTNAIKECVNSIILSNDKAFRIILINNFSSDSDLIEIKNIYNFYKEEIEIYLVENNDNIGYAGGNNSGVQYIENNNFDGNILILNPDIQISVDTISEMKKALVENIGIVTVRTLNPDGKIQYDAVKLTGFMQRNIITNKQSIATDYSRGSCMLINRLLVREIGLFDERFFLYWEEVDFSLRVKKTGKKLISITTSYVIQKDNSKSRNILAFYYFVRNAKLIRRNHKDYFSITSYLSFLTFTFLLIFRELKSLPVFKLYLLNYFAALRDSNSNKYYSKQLK
jgi:hypothetical protein